MTDRNPARDSASIDTSGFQPTPTKVPQKKHKVLSDDFMLAPGSTRIHGQVWYQDQEGVRAVFVGLNPFYTYPIADQILHRFCAAQLAEAKLAPIGKIVQVMGISESTLSRDRIRLVENGISGFATRPGPKAASKATPDVCDAIVCMFQNGQNKTQIASTLGLSEGTVRKVLKRRRIDPPAGQIHPAITPQLPGFDDAKHQNDDTNTDNTIDHQELEAAEPKTVEPKTVEPKAIETVSLEQSSLERSSAPAASDTLSEVGQNGHLDNAEPAKLGVINVLPTPGDQPTQPEVAFQPLDDVEATSIPYATSLDQVFTALGLIEEAPIEYQNTRAVANAGGLLGLALLSKTGLMQEARKIYGRLKNCWYGLRPLLWTLTVMALLRIKRPENMKERDPAALGAVVGLPRGPEVKTIRRKLSEVAERGKAAELHRALAKRRAEQQSDSIGTLYVDGHIRAYYGKRKIGRRFLTRKNGTEHGVMDGWVHTQDGQPLFVVHAACDESLTQLFPALLKEIREVVGPDRRVCLVFDRECWSYKLFWKILDADFDFMTYRKGQYEDIDDAEFKTVETSINGHQLKYELAEETFEKEEWPRLRLIAVKRSDGRQTQIVASGQQTWLSLGKAAGVPDAPAEQKCFRMFGRWSQENWLKYVKAEFALDVLIDYQTELDDADRLVPNSEWNRRDRAVRDARDKLQRVKAEYATELLKPKDKQDAEKRDNLTNAVRAAEEACEQAGLRRSEVPKRIRLGDCDGRDAVKLSYERKLFSDTVKLCAYDIETMLVKLLPESFRKTDHESRTVIRDFLQTTGDIRIESGCLQVSLDQQSAPRYTVALIHLCKQLNALKPVLPESDLRLEFFVNARPVG